MMTSTTPTATETTLRPSLLQPGMFRSRSVRGESGKWLVRKPEVDESAKALQEVLQEGQCLVDDLYHNATWWNRRGESIGWGDLSRLNLLTIRNCLPFGEVFMVLPEYLGDIDERGPDDVAFIVKKARLVITPQGLYIPEDGFYYPNPNNATVRGTDISASVESRVWVRALLDMANDPSFSRIVG